MIFTLTGASGAGKTTILKALQKENPTIQLVQSVTTRKPRQTDLHGEYFYVSEEEFQKLQTAGKFLWQIGAHGNAYGTPKDLVDETAWSESLFCMILVPAVMPTLLEYTKRKVIPFYILSPGEKELGSRLAERGEDEKSIQKRIQDCLLWDEEAKKDAAEGKIPYEFVFNHQSPTETFAVTKIKSIMEQKYRILI